jgi:hypothetical protein
MGVGPNRGRVDMLGSEDKDRDEERGREAYKVWDE